MKKTANELIAAFATGETPKGEQFRELIEAAYNVPDFELFDKNGRVTAPFKFIIDRTVVNSAQGDFSVDYSHVGFTEILFAQPTPVHEAVVIDDIYYLMSATFTNITLTSATGKAFRAGDSPGATDGFYRNAFGKQGDIIQYIIIGR